MKWIKKVATTPLENIAKVIDTLQSQTNDRTNAPSIRAVNEAISNKWETIYPIGSIFMCVNDINPSEVFGGTWVQIKDRFILAAGDTHINGETGGQEYVYYTPSATIGDHALLSNELPRHTHEIDKSNVVAISPIQGDTIYTNESGKINVQSGSSGYALATNSSVNYLDLDGNFIVSGEYGDSNLGGYAKAHGHSYTGTTATITTMPPYLAVKIWQRTA